MTAHKPSASEQFSFGAHYTIEDRNYASVAAIFRAAVQRGFEGSETALGARVKRATAKGTLTWATLLKPLSPRWKSLNAARKITGRRVDPDIAAAIKAIDKRKRELSS